MKIIATTALAAIAMVAGQAFAQTERNQEDPMSRSDTDAPMTGDASFDSLDANDDGYLDKSELLGNPGVAQHFAHLDSDSDGRISPAEWKQQGKHDDGDRK